MDDIPEDLSSLKRPALQRLCKKLGLKANGKNKDMIMAISSIKDARSIEPEQVISCDPLLPNYTSTEAPPIKSASPSPQEVCMTPPTSPKAVINKRRGRKKGRRGRKKEELEDESHVVQCAPIGMELERDLADEVVPDPCASTPSSLDEPQQEHIQQQSPSATTSERLAQKRKRSNTYSLSPNSSLLGVAKQPRLDQPEATPNDQEVDMDVPSNSEGDECSLKGDTPFPPPSSPEKLNLSETSRKRKLTFTIDSNSLSPPHCDEMEPRDCPQAKRRKCSTQDGVVGTEQGVSSNSEPKISDGAEDLVAEKDMKNEILNLLEQRVEERQADPTYKPMHTVSSDTLTSRIPVKSATANKFDKVHRKNFQGMQSITSCYDAMKTRRDVCNKKKRDSLTSRARASMRFNPPSVKYKTHCGREDRKKRVTTFSSSSSSSAGRGDGFKSSVTSMKKASLNFTSKDKKVNFDSTGLKTRNTDTTNSRTATKKPVSTPSSKPFSGENNPSIKKTTFDLGASLKKPKPKYKVYGGKLPPLNL